MHVSSLLLVSSLGRGELLARGHWWLYLCPVPVHVNEGIFPPPSLAACVTGCNFDTPDDLCGWESVLAAEGMTEWVQRAGPGDVPDVGPEDDFSKPGCESSPTVFLGWEQVAISGYTCFTNIPSTL